MSKKRFLMALFSSLFLVLGVSCAFAATALTQYGEISNIYNDEVKIRCKDPLTTEMYYFKFYLNWDTSFEGVESKSGLKEGDLISVEYKLDLDKKPIAIKVSLPKELTPMGVSRSGVQPYDEGNSQIKALQQEVKDLREQLDTLKNKTEEKPQQ